MALQLLGGSDAGQQQQLRRVEDPGRQDDLAARRSGATEPSAAADLDAGRPIAIQADAGHGRVGEDRQVGPVAGGVEVGDRRRLPATVDQAVGRGADAERRGDVEVVAARQAEVGRRLEQGADRWVGRIVEPVAAVEAGPDRPTRGSGLSAKSGSVSMARMTGSRDA